MTPKSFQFKAGLRADLKNELWNHEIIEFKKAYVLIQDLDTAKFSYTFRSHTQVLKSNSSQYPNQF